MPTNEPDQDAGRVIRERRDALDLTQEELGWLAGLSRNSVRNAEGAKSVEDKTLHTLELALALQPDAARKHDPEATILTAAAARALTHGILGLNSAKEAGARAGNEFRIMKPAAALSAYRYAMEAMATEGRVPASTLRLLRGVSPFMGAEQFELLKVELGLVTEETLEIPGIIEYQPLFAGTPSAERMASEPGNVPPDVAGLLNEGYMLDYGIVPAPTSNLNFVVLAIRTGHGTMGDSQRAVTVIDAVRQTVNPQEWLSARVDPPKIKLSDANPVPGTTGVYVKRDMSSAWRVVIEGPVHPLAISDESFTDQQQAIDAAATYVQESGFRPFEDEATESGDD